MSTTIAIPTYQREAVLVDTIEMLLGQGVPILVVDQTLRHGEEVTAKLAAWDRSEAIRWIRLAEPSIPKAMNQALRLATTAHVLFVDDDIIPSPRLVEEHEAAFTPGVWAVVGQVLQPGETPLHAPEELLHRGPIRDLEFRFHHDAACDVENVMAGNLSVDRERALAIGGFDENFIGAAYRFETDFARRIVAAGGRIRYWPQASIQHLKAAAGGIRAHGDHRATASPAHSAGDYYFGLHHAPSFREYALSRFWRNVVTRYHLTHPWTIPTKIAGEVRGLLVARRLARSGRKLLS